MSDLKKMELELIKTFEDMRLSKSESYDLKMLSQEISGDQRRFLKNKAFNIFRDDISKDVEDIQLKVSWLEKVIKALDYGYIEDEATHSSHFSPGIECKQKLLELILRARSQLDICVFTISDNDLTDAIVAVHKKGINVRVITDNDKSEDRGSDIDYLMEKNVDVRMDTSPNHMHHKYMVVDQAILANGSFNWTRSASKYNQENILVTTEKTLVRDFQNKFESLWGEFK